MESRRTLYELGNDEEGRLDIHPKHVEHCNAISGHQIPMAKYPTRHGREHLRGCKSIRRERAGDGSQPYHSRFLSSQESVCKYDKRAITG